MVPSLFVQFQTRTRLLLIAWALFLAGAPLLLLYARGYRVNPSSRAPLPAAPTVGALVVRTSPRGVTVDLDGEVIDERTPTGRGSIPVGNHRVRLSRPAYRRWEKRLEIRGGEVVALLGVRLLPEHLEEEVLVERVAAFWPSPDQRDVFIRTEGQRYAITSLKRGNPSARSFQLSVPSRERVESAWSPDGEAIAVSGRAAEGRGQLRTLVDAERGLTRSIVGRGEFLGWVNQGQPRAATLDAEGTVWLQSARGGDAEAIARDVSLAAPTREGLLFLRRPTPSAPGGLLLWVKGSVRAGPPPPPFPARALLASPTGALAAINADDGTLAIWLPDRQSWERLPQRASHALWSPDGTTLAFQETPFDLWVVNVSGERRPLAPLAPSLVVRLSTPVEHAQWFPDSQHLLYFEHDTLIFAEVDPRDGHRLERLLATDRGASPISVSRDGDALYVVVRREGRNRLVRVSLLAPQDR